MDNFNVTENTSKMYGKEAPSVFSEAFRDMQGKNNSLYSAEKDGFKKPLPQGFPELTIDGQLGNADSGKKKVDFTEKKEALERLNKKEEAELKQKKEDELVRQKKEGALDNGLKFDKPKNPSTDGGTKDSVNHQNSTKPAVLEGGPKDKPAPGKVLNQDGGEKNPTP